jgi:hypothetical protein
MSLRDAALLYKAHAFGTGIGELVPITIEVNADAKAEYDKFVAGHELAMQLVEVLDQLAVTTTNGRLATAEQIAQKLLNQGWRKPATTTEQRKPVMWQDAADIGSKMMEMDLVEPADAAACWDRVDERYDDEPF